MTLTQKILKKLRETLTSDNDQIKLFIHLEYLSSILTERQLLIILYRLEGYTFQEVAKKIKVSPSTISKERKKLKEILKESI